MSKPHASTPTPTLSPAPTAFILYRNSEPISVYLDPDIAEMDLITCRREDMYIEMDFRDVYEIRICSFVGE